MRIGELSKATGVSTRALRYYEQQGLLSSNRRSNGYREFTASAVNEVAFIQDLYGAGLPSEIIKEILPCVRQEQPQGDRSALLSRVREVRDELVRQERRIAERRQNLDRYLARTAAPRGMAVDCAAVEGACLNHLADEAEAEGSEGSISLEEMAAQLHAHEA